MRLLLLTCLSLFGVFSVCAQTGDISQVLATKASYDANTNDDTRAALLDALSAYDGPPTVETVQAHWAIMINDSVDADYENMRESALAVEAHITPVSEILPQQYIEAKYVAAVALFNDDQDTDAMLEMAHVEGFSKGFYDELGEQPDWAESLKWKSEAWGLAMDAYFVSVGERHPSENRVEEIILSYGYDRQKINDGAMEKPGATTGLPHCAGKLIQRPRLRYPAGGVRKGLFGAVILQFNFDPDGNVTDPEVMASVPFEEFEERSLKTVGKWKYKADQSRDVGTSCTLERSNVVLPLVFQLD
ncbi:MAG: energy transducer TonB [Pseudomonadota bacterium]